MKKNWVSLVSSVALGCAMSLLAFAQTNADYWTMQLHAADGRKLEAEIRGKFEFSEDERAIKALAQGGSVLLRESAAGLHRHVEISTQSDGSLRRILHVNGKVTPFDPATEEWLAARWLEIIRLNRMNAPVRVSRLHRQGSVAAVLNEIAQLNGDSIKAAYFSELIERHPLNTETVDRVARQIRRQISLAAEKNQLLARLFEKYPEDPATRTSALDVVEVAGSEYDRRQALTEQLRRGPLNGEQIKAVLISARRFASDYEKAELLIELHDANNAQVLAMPEYFSVIKTLDSEYEHSRVLLKLLNAETLNREALKRIIQSANAISGDFDKARVLLQVATRAGNDESVRQALVASARLISTAHDRERVLAVVNK